MSNRRAASQRIYRRRRGAALPGALGDRASHSLDIGDVDTDPVDLVGLDDNDRPARGIPRDRTVEGFARGLGEAFGVVEISQRRQLSWFEDACRDHQRAGTRTATCFVDACDRTKTTAVQRELERSQSRGPADRRPRWP